MAIKPPILRNGDTIGIVSLSSPMDAAEINARVATLRSIGFNVVLGRYVYERNGFLAGTAEQRASDLMSMFLNPNVRAIISTRGGVGAAGLLPYLDFPAIARNPKILSAYSDVSIIMNALYRFANLITIHSMMLKDFTPNEPEYNYNQFFSTVSAYSVRRQIANPSGIPLVSRVAGNVTGPIVGGNITSIVESLGTPFEIDTRGKIFFLEEVSEATNRLYRYINQLRLAGKIRDCIGIVMGECTECLTSYGVTYEDFINEVMVPLGKPLMTNLASGHGVYKAAIPIGATVNLNTINNTLTVVEPVISV